MRGFTKRVGRTVRDLFCTGASAGRTSIGGWFPEGDLSPWASQWFSLEITREDFPWVFEKGDRPSLVISTLEALAILVALKLRFGDQLESDDTRVFITDNRGNGAVLNKLISTFLKARRMITVVEWAPRECNKEADLPANGTLSWCILPEGLETGRDAERAFQDMRQTVGLPNWSQKHERGRWRQDSRSRIPGELDQVLQKKGAQFSIDGVVFGGLESCFVFAVRFCYQCGTLTYLTIFGFRFMSTSFAHGLDSSRWIVFCSEDFDAL